MLPKARSLTYPVISLEHLYSQVPLQGKSSKSSTFYLLHHLPQTKACLDH